MLQQTQVATVIPYFERWLHRFPTVAALASAEEAEVLALWSGLGYYRRARMLHAGAKWVSQNGFPASAGVWRQVPGVGRYTAGAIASIALGERAALVDGNVERVFSRFTNCHDSGAELTRAAWRWSESILPERDCGEWNQALMELGATVCQPAVARCTECPLRDGCEADVPLALPVRPPKREVVHLERRQYVPRCGDALGFVQIPPGKWWAGMYEFPEKMPIQGTLGETLPPVRHAVTHHRIKIHAQMVLVPKRCADFAWVTITELASLALPSAQRKLAEYAFA